MHLYIVVLHLESYLISVVIDYGINLVQTIYIFICFLSKILCNSSDLLTHKTWGEYVQEPLKEFILDESQLAGSSYWTIKYYSI